MTEPPLSVAVVDDDQSVRWVLEQALQQAGMQVQAFGEAAAFLQGAVPDQFDVIITDIRMPGMDGIELLEHLQDRQPELPVIVITAHSDLDSAVSAYQGGAFEYLPKPFDIDEVVALVARAARRGDGNHGERADDRDDLPALIGQAPAMQTVFRAIGRLARSSVTVLVTGESGTGKELVARALHANSPRADAPFIALNTSAIAAELLESELFGHEKGAFTGADARRIGRFEQAHRGTLFLDEIGDMSVTLQTRLLRVLAEGEFYRVGGQVPLQVDVRVIAATHQDLQAAVASGAFREDLYHRLNVMRIETPPLRDRRDDIPLLLNHYLRAAADELGVDRKSLAEPAMAALVAADWPGNVRELVNVCRRLTVAAPGDVIGLDDVTATLGGAAADGRVAEIWQLGLERWAEQQLARSGTPPLLDQALPALEKILIRTALRHARGQRGEAARLLGWGRNTLTRKIAQHKLDL